MKNLNPVFTIGHSTHDFEHFLDLLVLNKVSVIADVRSSPYSRFNPQFNRENLQEALKTHGIKYVYLGKQLGARSDDPSCYENGKVQYSKLAETELFKSGLERVVHGAQEHRIALMCAEKEPLECHRTILVSQELEKNGIKVVHILADGTQEPHQSTLNRLFQVLNLPFEDLFRSQKDLQSDAIKLQESKIAYSRVEGANVRSEMAT